MYTTWVMAKPVTANSLHFDAPTDTREEESLWQRAQLWGDEQRCCRWTNEKQRMLPSVQSCRRDGTTHSPQLSRRVDWHRNPWTQEDGSDGRGRHRRQWVDHRPMRRLLDRDNDGSSYVREENREAAEQGSKKRSKKGWKKIATDTVPIIIAKSLRVFPMNNVQ